MVNVIAKNRGFRLCPWVGGNGEDTFETHHTACYVSFVPPENQDCGN